MKRSPLSFLSLFSWINEISKLQLNDDEVEKDNLLRARLRFMPAGCCSNFRPLGNDRKFELSDHCRVNASPATDTAQSPLWMYVPCVASPAVNPPD